MEKLNNCKYCSSENLYLEPKNENEDVLTADQVAIKCKDCGKWLGWCPKSQREEYIPQYIEEEKTEETSAEAETIVKDAENQATTDAETTPTETENIEPVENDPLPETSAETQEQEKGTCEEVIEGALMLDKNKLLDFVINQKKIVRGSFVLEQGKAMSLIDNIIRYINEQ